MPRAESLPITILLTALVALGSFSTSVYTPSMPALTAAFHTTTDQVKLTLSVFLLGFGLGQLVYGPISDRFGRRRILVAGLALFAFGSACCALAGSIEAMIAGRFVQAFGACAGPALGRAIVRDVHGKEGTARVLAWISAATAVSPAIGPTLGGHLHVWFGWRAIFVLVTALGVVLALAVALLLDETNRYPDGDATNLARMGRNFATLLRDPGYLGYLLCGSCVFAGLYSYIAVGPFLFVDRLGFSPEVYGTLTIITTSCYIAGSFLSARVTPALGLDRPILLGCALATLGGAFMLACALFILSAVTLILPMMVFSLGMGLTLPNAFAGGLIPFPRMAGAASALLGFLQQMAAAGATVLVATLPQYSAVSVASVIAALGAVAIASWLLLIRPRSLDLVPAATD
jgi:DHA1 family bicyclomycin/chloramphenicol resistance-like MFS transporter